VTEQPQPVERACPECGTRTHEPTCPIDGEMTLVQRKQDESQGARPGSLIGGRYRIERVVGQGGFGAVYKAQHAATGDTVAIKVLRTDVQGSSDVVARFRHEAKATSKLKHPNTVRVFDFGQMDDGNLYIAMEFLDGRTFTDLLRREGPLQPERLVRIAVQVLKSLSEAHAKGLVHRDLKPDNIFLQTVHGEADFVRVLDFGIAKSLSGDTAADMTSTGAIIGTPRYMSPEQARGTPVDARTDLYSLAIILFEGLTGVAPFLADSPLSMLLRRVAEEPPRVHDSLALPTPVGVCDAVLRGLAREPDERFASADAMMTALLAGLDTPPMPAQSPVASARAEAQTRVEVDGSVGDLMGATLGEDQTTGRTVAAVAEAMARPKAPQVDASVSRMPTTAIEPRPNVQPIPVAAPTLAVKSRTPWLGIALGVAALLVAIAALVLVQARSAPAAGASAVATPAPVPTAVPVAAPVPAPAQAPVAAPQPVVAPAPVQAPGPAAVPAAAKAVVPTSAHAPHKAHKPGDKADPAAPAEKPAGGEKPAGSTPGEGGLLIR
jgi:hypothetical protein